MKLLPQAGWRLVPRLLGPFLWICWLIGLVGCHRLPVKPRSFLSTPAATLTQTGPAEVPASVEMETVTETQVTPLGRAPADEIAPAVPVVIGPRPVPPATSPIPSIVATWRLQRSLVTAAKTYAPPAPPSPAALAAASGVRWFWLAGLACLLTAGVLAWSQHYLAALKLAAAGVALPLLAHFFSSGVALTVGIALITAGAAFVVAWYVLARRHPALAPEVTAKP